MKKKGLQFLLTCCVCATLALGFSACDELFLPSTPETELEQGTPETENEQTAPETQPEHEHAYTAVVTAPTCTEKGYTTHTCECGDSYVDTYVNKLGHDYTITTVTAPTCAERGYTTHTCECGDSYVDTYVDKLRHNFVNDVCQGCLAGTSKGLAFTLNSDGESYTVTGKGTCTDTEIFIPSKHFDLPVTSVGEDAFAHCSLTEIVIPNSVTSIGEDAFYDCSRLTSVVIGDSVMSIGSYAFEDCSNLTEIVIPDSVTDIVGSVFRYCYKLTIYCETTEKPNGWSSSWNGYRPIVWNCNENEVADDGYIYTIIGGVRYGLYSDGTAKVAGQPTNIVTANIAESVEYKGITYIVTSIGYEAFSDCSNLTEIVIPDSVTSIGRDAFRGCDSLTSVVIDNGVTSIGRDAFYSCDSLTIYCEVERRPRGWDEDWNSDGCPVVWNCNEHEVANDGYIYTIIDGIRYGLYSDGTAKVAGQPTNIVTTNIVESVEYKGITYSVTSIGERAFYNCDSLTEIVIPDSVTSIGEWAFSGCDSLTEIVIPNSVTSIGNYAFYSCSRLTSAVIGDSVTSIGYEAFSVCSNLTEIVIPDSVTSIGIDAFRTCYSLTEIVIPDSITSIGRDAFYGCYSLTIYCEVKSKPSGWNSDWNDFNCPVVWNCNENEIADDGYIYAVIDGVRYGLKSNKAMVVMQPRNIVTANIAESVEYKGNTYTVTSIGDYAFYSCGSLTEIVIPDSVTSISQSAFSRCSSLTEIIIPDSVTSIGQYAFSGCSSLTIYCEVESEPSGWDDYWNYSNRPVAWGYTGEE